MPARHGNWPLLNQASDPVVGDPAGLTDLIGYYTEMAETITSEARMLQSIADGDTSQAAGQSADAIRKRSGEVAKSLTQTAGRYEAVRDALTTYAPELDIALDESRKALLEAQTADDQRGSSSAMPDPSANRADDAPPMTDEENAAVHARTTAMTSASDSAGSAIRRLSGALSALNTAGAAAAGVIKESFNDGLVDTTAYKIRQWFIKILKVLVKVLMWIGIALAVIAFFIPGLGALALAAAAVAVVAVAATTALAAMGEGSWLDVIMAVVGVVLIGVGAVVSKIVQTGQKLALQTTANAGKVTGAAKNFNGVDRLASGLKIPKVAEMTAQIRAVKLEQLAIGRANPGAMPGSLAKINAMNSSLKNMKVQSLEKVAKIGDDFKLKPQFWNIKHPDYLKNDFAKFKDLKGNFSVINVLSVDRVVKYNTLRSTMQQSLGLTAKATPAWQYFNGGRIIFGGINNIYKLTAVPTGFLTDTSRWAALEQAKLDLTTAKPA